MRGIIVTPLQRDSARLADLPEPVPGARDLLVQAIAIGICGTDREIIDGLYGSPPPGRDTLILGHESIGRVLQAPSGAGFSEGDLVVGIVRRPDPVPCPYCAAGEFDMCRNGQYTERGIKDRDGYGAERFTVEANYAVKVEPSLGLLGVLLEPASVVAKAWDHAERIGGRSSAWRPRTALITGAGPIGLLAALMGVQRDLEVHVFDRVTTGPKPTLVRDLGATYHAGDLSVVAELSPDVIIECTGATPVIADAITRSAPSGIVCLAGVSSGGHAINLDLGDVNKRIVLENDAVFGSVNANRRHYELAADALGRADRAWMTRLITRRIPLDRWHEALDRHPDDVKVVVEFEPAA